MLPNEVMYPYTAKEARDRGELELWRANFRTNCACAGAIELAIHRDFDGMYLKDGCAKSVIDQYGYKRVGYVLANTLQLHAYDGRYHETNKRWSSTIFVPEDGGHRHTFLINSHPAILDGFVSNYRAELAKLHLFGAEHCEPNSGEQDFTGRVLVLSPDTLRESCWQPENQLWLAFSGFGCRPHARGHLTLEAVRCSVPVWATVRQRDGIAPSSWASSATSASPTGRRRSWPSCGRARTHPPWAK